MYTIEQIIRDQIADLTLIRDRASIKVEALTNLLATIEYHPDNRAAPKKEPAASSSLKAPVNAVPKKKTKAPVAKKDDRRKTMWTPARRAAMSKKMNAKHAAKLKAQGKK